MFPHTPYPRFPENFDSTPFLISQLLSISLPKFAPSPVAMMQVFYARQRVRKYGRDRKPWSSIYMGHRKSDSVSGEAWGAEDGEIGSFLDNAGLGTSSTILKRGWYTGVQGIPCGARMCVHTSPSAKGFKKLATQERTDTRGYCVQEMIKATGVWLFVLAEDDAYGTFQSLVFRRRTLPSIQEVVCQTASPNRRRQTQ